MNALRIYVASSWRNLLQPAIVHALRRIGHEVYDFRHPSPGLSGFSWSEIDPAWRDWTPAQYREALEHPIAERGHGHDIEALRSCDACVLVLPSGRSAWWEFGYAMGQGKRAAVVMFEPCEPELMYRGATILTNISELFDEFGEPKATVVLCGQGRCESPAAYRYTWPGKTESAICFEHSAKLVNVAAAIGISLPLVPITPEAGASP